MACPFFVPEQPSEAELWQHRHRLPLGDGFDGHCSVPGQSTIPLTHDELKVCNLGYARNCSRLPEKRIADAVRFTVVRDHGASIDIHFVAEREHLPASHGLLTYDCSTAKLSGADPLCECYVQALAGAFLKSYLRRNPRANSAAT